MISKKMSKGNGRSRDRYTDPSQKENLENADHLPDFSITGQKSVSSRARSLHRFF